MRLERVESCGGLLFRLAVGGSIALMLLLVLVTRRPAGPADVILVAAAAVASAAWLSPRALEPLTIAASVASPAATLFVATRGTGPEPSVVFEAGGLLLVIVKMVWKAPKSRMVQLTALVTLALAVLPLRASSVRAHAPLSVLASMPLLVLVALAVGAGAYLRALADRRERALAAVRAGERLELARDLHDFVAHHVTGIVVQAQAARYAARSGVPQTAEQIDTMFAAIEKSGAEALTSMRRLVGLLRDAEPAEPGQTRPLGDLDRLTELVHGFTDPPAQLDLDPALPDLPPEVAASACRVVQEALTNVRKHAADATQVQVRVGRVADVVEVSVRDDGQGRGRLLPAGGYGLAGLTERVQALGGELRSGPRPEGGWEVVARLGKLRESAL
jgi:signal transduction histidine kinase